MRSSRLAAVFFLPLGLCFAVGSSAAHGDTDTEGPILDHVRFTTDSIDVSNGGATATLEFIILDETGFSYGYNFVLVSPESSNQYSLEITQEDQVEGTPQAGIYNVDIFFPESTTDSSWRLFGGTLVDVLSNISDFILGDRPEIAVVHGYDADGDGVRSAAPALIGGRDQHVQAAGIAGG